MPRYLAARIGSMVLALVVVSIGLFALIHAAPGDAADVLLPPRNRATRTSRGVGGISDSTCRWSSSTCAGRSGDGW